MANKLRYSNFAHRIDIDAMVDALELDLEDDGQELRGHCPLPYGAHKNGDTTGKFGINRDKRIYGCWVCGGGSLLDLAMALRDLEMEPAIKWLYQFASHEETDEEFMDQLDALLADPADQVTPVPYFNPRVLDRWESATDHPWLTQRGISREVAELFQLRYSATARRTNKEEVYEGPCIYLPHMWRGKLVGWQQRWLESEEDRPRWVPKYTMTPDFPKNESLFADDLASKPREHGWAFTVVVESVPSALFLWSHEVPAVCTFGSSVSDDQLRLLRRYNHLVLAPDNDPAGEKWENTLLDYLDRYTHVSVLPPVTDDPGSDIGDLAEAPELLKPYLGLAFDSLDTAL